MNESELQQLTLVEAAVHYAKAGLAIIPLVGKRPTYGNDWWTRAITDPAEAAMVFASDSRYTNIGWCQGYGTVAIDIDDREFASEAEWAEFRRGANNVTQRNRDTGMPTKGHKVFHTEAAWGASTAGFPSRGWGDVRGRGGQIVIWGPHPSRDDFYAYDAGQQPPELTDILQGWLTPADRYEGAATPRDVATFLSTYNGVSTSLESYTGVLKAAREREATREGLHATLVSCMVWAYREAAQGHYPASVARERLLEWWNEAWERRRLAGHGRTAPGRDEFARAELWAVGQIEAPPSDPEILVSELPPPDFVERLNLVDWVELFDAPEPDEAERWLWPEVIPRGRQVAVFAKGGSGKSELLLWIAARMCLGVGPDGEEWEPSTVLYLDYEMTPDDLKDRMRAFGFTSEHGAALQKRLHYAQFPHIAPLDLAKGGAELLEAAQSVGADLVVIDTLARVVEGNENDADTYRRFYDHTGMLLKREGIALVRLDHAGKAKEQTQRGSSAKSDDVDVVLELVRTVEPSQSKLNAKKRRMGWYPAEVTFGRELTPSGGVSYVLGGATILQRTMDRLAELELPLDVGRPTAMAALHEAGYAVSNNVLATAIRQRKELLEAAQWGEVK